MPDAAAEAAALDLKVASGISFSPASCETAETLVNLRIGLSSTTATAPLEPA